MIRRDRVLVAGALALLFAVAGLIVAVVVDAQNRGRGALEDQKLDQIETLARSMDARISSSFPLLSDFVSEPYDLRIGSEADQEILDEFQELQPNAATGSVLVDLDQRITAGTLLLDDDVVGEVWDRAGLADMLRSGRPAVLPVDEGVTTTMPTYALAVPLPDRTGAIRGAYVFEGEVSASGSFNQEVAALGSSGGEFLFVDVNEMVVAANSPDLLGRRLDDDAVRLPAGLHRRGGQVIAIAEVPTAGWRAVFRQDATDFEAGLSERLQTVLLLVIAVALTSGAVIVFGLVSRLRNARQEQQRLTELNETREEFISIVSHELRTPVAGVLGFLQTSIDHWDSMTDDERRSAVVRANANARRLQVLTRDVLDATAVERGELAYTFAPIDLREELASAVTAMNDLQPQRQVTLSVPDGEVRVRGDADRLLQVVMNLFENAVNSSPPESPIAVALTVAGEDAAVSITDRGAGLSADKAESMFEKFVRGRSTTRGSGLGLYLVREIVMAHGGTVRGEPAAGGGTTFTFTVPLAAATAPTS